jgi:hypothetical protein
MPDGVIGVSADCVAKWNWGMRQYRVKQDRGFEFHSTITFASPPLFVPSAGKALLIENDMNLTEPSEKQKLAPPE